MKSLTQLKEELDTLETKIMVYQNELGDSERVQQLKDEVKRIDALILDLMVGESQERVNAAIIA